MKEIEADKVQFPVTAVWVLFAVALIVIWCVTLLWCVLSALSLMLY